MFAGGRSMPGQGADSNLVDIYDYSTNTWTVAALSQARFLLASSSVGHKALFAGGYLSSGFSSVVDIYDSASNSWSTATLSVARGGLAAASVGNKALFAGGGALSIGVVADVDIYDNSADAWSTAQLSAPRWNLAGTAVGNKALFAGGGNLTGDSDVVDIFDGVTNAWSVAHLSQARSYLTATACGGKAFFAGGAAVAGASNRIDIYDYATNTWSVAFLSQGRLNLCSTAIGTKVLFAGGFTGISGVYSDVVDIYDLSTDSWSVASLSIPRESLAATSVGNRVMIGGGEMIVPTGSAGSDRVDIYTAFPDCNLNGVPDSEDIANGTSTDCNGNGMPDECEGHTVIYCTAKTNSLGCVPVIGTGGGCAESPSISGPDDFRVIASHVLNNKVGLLIWGAASNSVPFHGGTLCVGAPLARTGIQSSGGSVPPTQDCSGAYSFHFSQAFMANELITAGSNIYAQYWSRDPGFPVPDNIGLTNAVHFVVIP
jgi:hypothetical protein